jgi:bacillithiol biosynthesis cysteine-adding enzyme BshC
MSTDSPPAAPDPDERRAAVQRARRPVHPAVLDTLVVTTDAQASSREALAHGVAVVTGQQAGLFGGPLYTVHKAVAAIVDARRLAEETGVPVAPVFWLQDEDHDFEEIRTATLLDATGSPVDVSLPDDPALAEHPVTERRLTESVQTVLDAAARHLDGLPHADEVVAFLRASHPVGRPVTDAFREGVEHLFAPHGLLVVDPMHPALREAAAPVHARAFDEAAAIAASIPEGPVHVRPDAPLSFVHPDGEAGPRYRVAPVEGGFELVGTDRRVSAAAVREMAHSTSALLRPILQDTLLPTAMIVGGPGELAYLRQVVPIWRHFGLPVPAIVHRARFVLLDAGIRRTLGQLGLEPADLHRPRPELLKLLGADDPAVDTEALYDALTAGALAALADVEPVVEDLTPGTAKAVGKTRDTILHASRKLVERIQRDLTRGNDTRLARLERVRHWVQPHDAPQERVVCWPSFAARTGTEALVEALVDAAVPFSGALVEVAV